MINLKSGGRGFAAIRENDFELHFQLRYRAHHRPIVGPREIRMIVCHCHALSDRAIRDVIRRGAHSPREVAIACKAGRRCGGCVPVVRELIETETSCCPADCAELPVAAAS
jgi:bacterioferritin-associated ferredoxin